MGAHPRGFYYKSELTKQSVVLAGPEQGGPTLARPGPSISYRCSSPQGQGSSLHHLSTAGPCWLGGGEAMSPGVPDAETQVALLWFRRPVVVESKHGAHKVR